MFALYSWLKCLALDERAVVVYTFQCACASSVSSVSHPRLGSHVNAVVYSDDSCQNPIVKKSQLDGAIKLDLKKCNPTSGIFFAPGSFYKADCVVSFSSRLMAFMFCFDIVSLRPNCDMQTQLSHALASGSC